MMIMGMTIGDDAVTTIGDDAETTIGDDYGNDSDDDAVTTIDGELVMIMGMAMVMMQLPQLGRGRSWRAGWGGSPCHNPTQSTGRKSIRMTMVS